MPDPGPLSGSESDVLPRSLYSSLGEAACPDRIAAALFVGMFILRRLLAFFLRFLLMVHFTVLPQKAPLGKDPRTSAYSALVALVTTLMGLQSTWQQERPVASRLRARIRQHLGVLVAVNFQLLVLDKRFWTELALKSPLLVRDVDVLVERVLGRELLPTLLEGAPEILRRSCLGLGCVHRLDVPCQVVLPGVLAGAPLESACKGPLVRVETHVPVESGSLGEHCVATLVRAHEN